MRVIIGWDIGGVHLKAARAENGKIVDAIQLPSPLRAGLEALINAFEIAASRMGDADLHVITMTGELADTFASRAEGVSALTDLARRAIGENARVYAGRAGFVSLDAAPGHVVDIASANWHASAALVGQYQHDAIFLDIGSTTTDIIPVVSGKVAARGYSDAERLAVGELVYTGMVRSFLMAVSDRVPFKGVLTPLINENFASIADVHRLLGRLPPHADLMPSADGREKTMAASRARLARIVGRDATEASDAEWELLARYVAERQLRMIMDAAMLVLSSEPALIEAPIVRAGIGFALADELARRLGRPVIAFESLLRVENDIADAVAQCAPAAALAILGDQAC